MSSIQIVSVNVSQPKIVGLHRGKPVESGIDKRPVSVTELRLSCTNLDGDGQADLRVHGGNEKAVYAYPSEHLPLWEKELGQILGPGSFGENLTTQGAVESDIHIGDRWIWGEAVLEISKPRLPCYKLNLHHGVPDMIERMKQSGRCGWYLRVIQPGMVPTRGIIPTTSSQNGITVLERFRQKTRSN